MSEVSKEIIKRREDQLRGLENLFTQVFTDYYESYGELPKLATQTDVDVFVQGRPEIWRTVQRQDLVLTDVTKVALEVLDKMRKSKEIEKTEEAA